MTSKRNTGVLNQPEKDTSSDLATHLAYLIFFLLFLIVPVFLTYEPGPSSRLSVFGINMPPTCGTKYFFDIDCPACGLTRSFTVLAQGDIRESIRFHRLGPLIFLFFLYQVGYRTYGLRTLGTPVPKVLSRIHTYGGSVLIALLVANWLFGLATTCRNGS
jgi:hypothetical protein